MCHYENIPAHILCFHVPGSFDAYSTGCVYHYKRIHLVKYGQSWKKVFSYFNVFGIAICYEMYTGLPCSCISLCIHMKINVVNEKKIKKKT